ncbi:hypothetical protein M9H77_16600 [Catharanthus roseus]|uniref:Uncharacterized protein n=1 Tax=Catharanthus roseus TaxID=4058 RepID=A0ACC0B268_CATRO|nr:hypothetical protein M9H77_16600 [Catharanthus roseus]
MPKVRIIFSKIYKGEQHRNLTRKEEVVSDGVAFAVNKPARPPKTSLSSSTSAPTTSPSSSTSVPFCSHCLRTSHDIQACFHIVGYLDWWPKNAAIGVGRRGALSGRCGGRGTFLAGRAGNSSRNRGDYSQAEQMQATRSNNWCRRRGMPSCTRTCSPASPGPCTGPAPSNPTTGLVPSAFSRSPASSSPSRGPTTLHSNSRDMRPNSNSIISTTYRPNCFTSST